MDQTSLISFRFNHEYNSVNDVEEVLGNVDLHGLTTSCDPIEVVSCLTLIISKSTLEPLEQIKEEGSGHIQIHYKVKKIEASRSLQSYN